MYEFESRVRYSEVDSGGKLTWLALMDYFQDCSVFHSEQVHLGVDYLAEHHLAWVLTFWQICVNRRPKLGESITVQTWPYEMKSFYGYRNFAMKDEKGDCPAYANSIWVLVNSDTGRPTQVPREITDGYGMEERLSMDYCNRKIVLPQKYQTGERFLVPSYYIDTNHHMNNSRYVQAALNYLPEGFLADEVRVEYRKPAMQEDVIVPRVTNEEGKSTVALCAEDGSEYAAVVFLQKKI